MQRSSSTSLLKKKKPKMLKTVPSTLSNLTPPKIFQYSVFTEQELNLMIDQMENLPENFKKTVNSMGQCDKPFVFYPKDKCTPKAPKVITKPTIEVQSVEYLMTACEEHAMDCLEKLISGDKKQKFVTRLFLYNVIRAGIRLKMEPESLCYMLEIFYEGITMFFEYRNMTQLQIENYFTERIIVHSVEKPIKSKEVFKVNEAKEFTKLYGRFIRLMPLLHVYYYRPFVLCMGLLEFNPMLHVDCVSENNIVFEHTILPSSPMTMDVKPKMFPNLEGLSQCKAWRDTHVKTEGSGQTNLYSYASLAE